MTNYGRSVFVP